MLQGIDFNSSSPATPKFDTFDQSRVQEIIKSCEELQPSGVKLVNVIKLKTNLKEEFSQIQGVTSINQWQNITTEIKVANTFIKNNILL